MTEDLPAVGREAHDSLDAELYPDLVESGGLALAMRAAAGRQSIDLGPIHTQSGDGLFTTAELESTRGPVTISLGSEERFFSVTMSHEFQWAEGSTTDLDQVVAVIAGWQGGMGLRELSRRFPFVHPETLALAYEDGRHLEVQWAFVLGAPNLEIAMPVLRAAHANPRLRGLFPGTSHRAVVTFDRDYANRRAGTIQISLQPEGTLTVEDVDRPDSARTVAAVDEAIELAASYV
jgi:hypothetical protein